MISKIPISKKAEAKIYFHMAIAYSEFEFGRDLSQLDNLLRKTHSANAYGIPNESFGSQILFMWQLSAVSRAHEDAARGFLWLGPLETSLGPPKQ